MRDALWPTTEGEVHKLGKLSAAPTTEDPETGEMLKGVGPGEHGMLQSSAGEALPFFTVYGHIDGARLAFVSVSSITVGTTGVRSSMLDSTGTSYVFFDGTIAADLTTDLDTGFEAADTLYAVIIEWEAKDPTNIKATFTISPTAPTLSGGRDKFRRVGWIVNNGTSDFLKFTQFDSGPDRRVEYDEEQSTTQILTGGNATVYTTVSAASFVPPTARHGILHYEWDPGTPTGIFSIRPNGSTVTTPIFTISSKNDTEAGSHPFFTDTSQEIQFKVANATDSLDLFVAGYVDNL